MELNVIRQADPQVADAIEAELNRQRSHIELIASENFVSPAVMAAMGSCLTNKYAEGLSRAPLLRRLRDAWMWWKTSPVTALSSLFGCRVRQRAAAFRRAGEYWRCTSPCSSRAIPCMGMSLSRRRPSHARQPGQPVRQVLPFRALRRGSRRAILIMTLMRALALRAASRR